MIPLFFFSPVGPVLGVPTNNLRTRTMNFTKSLVEILKNIYYHPLLRLSTSIQEHGTDSIYCYHFSSYKYNFSSKTFTTSVQVFKKSAKLRSLYRVYFLIPLKHNKWSCSLLPYQRHMLCWVACCECDKVDSGVAIVYGYLYISHPRPISLSALFPAVTKRGKVLYTSFEP